MMYSLGDRESGVVTRHRFTELIYPGDTLFFLVDRSGSRDERHFQVRLVEHGEGSDRRHIARVTFLEDYDGLAGNHRKGSSIDTTYDNLYVPGGMQIALERIARFNESLFFHFDS